MTLGQPLLAPAILCAVDLLNKAHRFILTSYYGL